MRNSFASNPSSSTLLSETAAPVPQPSGKHDKAVVGVTTLDEFDRSSGLCLDGRITRLSEHVMAFGGFADVWEGLLGDQRVAIKAIRPFTASGRRIPESKLLKRLRREYLAWTCLSHPNVLQCLGFSYDFFPSYALPTLISPWISNGTIFPYLDQHPGTDRLKLLLGVAHGLSYLHDKDIAHGDLRAGNILILDSGVPCLSDFGLSRTLRVEEMSASSELAGTLRWMSPELMVDNVVVSSTSDVWAYGMTVLEVISGNRPCHEVQKEPGVLAQISGGQIPLRPQDTSILTDEIWSICQQCWAYIPSYRPTMHAVTSKLVACHQNDSDKYDV